MDYGGLGTRESRFWTDYSGLWWTGLERAGFGLTTVDYGGLGTRESRFWTDYSGLWWTRD